MEFRVAGAALSTALKSYSGCSNLPGEIYYELWVIDEKKTKNWTELSTEPRITTCFNDILLLAHGIGLTVGKGVAS